MREAAPDPPLLGAAVRRRLSGGGEEKTKKMKGRGCGSFWNEGRRRRPVGGGAAVTVGSLGGGRVHRDGGSRVRAEEEK